MSKKQEANIVEYPTTDTTAERVADKPRAGALGLGKVEMEIVEAYSVARELESKLNGLTLLYDERIERMRREDPRDPDIEPLENRLERLLNAMNHAGVAAQELHCALRGI